MAANKKVAWRKIRTTLPLASSDVFRRLSELYPPPHLSNEYEYQFDRFDSMISGISVYALLTYV
jgi:hypothetical protein